ncbi:MAG TPA: DUF362 domain-containing protein [Bryobacteraceae bacterium]|jgi:uncharacterized protein (DUF362 family)|nr:DUF362 domain-containing protein [Bryobacteraceae bacterium]
MRRRTIAGLNRRSFLQSLAAGSAVVAAAKPSKGANTPAFQVGVGYSSDPYTAASTALSACAQFPTNLAGQTVVIKPNLVVPKPSSSGATTDPNVVKAVVDMCIAAGAEWIYIVEAPLPGNGPYWGPCGYAAIFTAKAYPQVTLTNLVTGTYVLTPVPGGGSAYQQMYVPQVVLEPNTFFISVGKLKTHQDAVVTLSMKNLVGLASEPAYAQPVNTDFPRHDLHLRSINQSIIDLNMIRPIDFAVIDGVWGMDGEGPTTGTPVATNVVLAGLNPVAVDRVALNVMEFAQNSVTYLSYASQADLGPPSNNDVTLLGDSYIPYPFVPATTPPVLWKPTATPATISISAGNSTTIAYAIPAECFTHAEIIQDSDVTPTVVPIRTLHTFKSVKAPGESLVWNGLDNNGDAVAPGTYYAQIQAIPSPSNTSYDNYALTRITVTA